ncbi:MAG: DoxX family protein [Planctomycetota bacterium]
MSPPSQSRLQSIAHRVDAIFTPLAQLLTRLVFGQAFLIAGLGKLKDLDQAVKNFEAMGIPMANVQAPFIAALEFGGGILLLAGLGTRVFAFLLSCTMVVAFATTEMSRFPKGFTLEVDFSDITPLPFLVGMLWLLAKGAGKLSLDHLLARRAGRA